jgi:hypothetical protein
MAMSFTVFFPNPSSPSDAEDQEEVSNTDVASKELFPLQANLSEILHSTLSIVPCQTKIPWHAPSVTVEFFTSENTIKYFRLLVSSLGLSSTMKKETTHPYETCVLSEPHSHTTKGPYFLFLFRCFQIPKGQSHHFICFTYGLSSDAVGNSGYTASADRTINV